MPSTTLQRLLALLFLFAGSAVGLAAQSTEMPYYLSGTTLPPTCTTGTLFIKTDAPPHQTQYICRDGAVWEPVLQPIQTEVITSTTANGTTAQINTAIAAACQNPDRALRRVVIPNGIYDGLYTNPIRIEDCDGLVLDGMSAQRTILRETTPWVRSAPNNTYSSGALEIVNSSYVTIKNISIQGSNFGRYAIDGATNANPAVFDAKTSVDQGLNLDTFNGGAVVIYGATGRWGMSGYLTLTKVDSTHFTLKQVGSALPVNGTDLGPFHGTGFSPMMWQGIYVTGTDNPPGVPAYHDITVENCMISGFMTGIFMDPKYKDVGTGFLLNSPYNIKILGNTIFNMGFEGINLGWYGFSSGNEIAFNSIDNTTDYGIEVTEATENIHDNQLSRCARCISVTNVYQSVVGATDIHHNIIRGEYNVRAPGTGIYIGAASNVRVEYNDVSGFGGPGIFHTGGGVAGGRNNTTYGNHVHGNGYNPYTNPTRTFIITGATATNPVLVTIRTDSGDPALPKSGSEIMIVDAGTGTWAGLNGLWTITRLSPSDSAYNCKFTIPLDGTAFSGQPDGKPYAVTTAEVFLQYGDSLNFSQNLLLKEQKGTGYGIQVGNTTIASDSIVSNSALKANILRANTASNILWSGEKNSDPTYTTLWPHYLRSGDIITVSGAVGEWAVINGARVVNVTSLPSNAFKLVPPIDTTNFLYPIVNTDKGIYASPIGISYGNYSQPINNEGTGTGVMIESDNDIGSNVQTFNRNLSGRQYLLTRGDSVESKPSTVLGPGSFFHITGTTTIQALQNCTSTNPDALSREVTLIFDAALTVQNVNNIKLDTDKGNFATAPGSLLKLTCDASTGNWYEIARKK